MVRVHQPPGGETHLNDDLPKKPFHVRVQQPPGGKTHIDEEIAPKQPNVRVLKPPGGGSSISFGEEEETQPQCNNVTECPPLENKAPTNDNNPSQEGESQPQQPQNAVAETNGTSSPPQSPKDNASSSSTTTATKENNSTATTTTTTATTNGVAAINGTVVTNGTSSSGSSTPNSSRLDTQSRLFGEEAQKGTPGRRVRDHHRSNIFTDGEENKIVAKSANPAGNETPEQKTPEAKTPDQLQPQQQAQVPQRQRVPPGGFSSKLW